MLLIDSGAFLETWFATKGCSDGTEGDKGAPPELLLELSALSSATRASFCAIEPPPRLRAQAIGADACFGDADDSEVQGGRNAAFGHTRREGRSVGVQAMPSSEAD
jgi:hypothetical protein